MMSSLKEYNKKRDFKKTGEPKGTTSKKKTKKPIFVIQKHEATNLHYDFRLEIGGVLKSWAIPKGPSTDPAVKRMAIPTEDHPLEYANFEGVIPEKEYGGGTVMIWDKGSFKNINKDEKGQLIDLKKSYSSGSIEIELQGKKIKGGYALVKMKSGEMEGNWLLIKMKDDEADARRNPVSTQNKSVKSGETMSGIKKKNKK